MTSYSVGGLNKTVQHSIKNISRNIKACSSNLASIRTVHVHHKRSKMLSCHCHDNSYAAGPVLFKTIVSRGEWL